MFSMQVPLFCCVMSLLCVFALATSHNSTARTVLPNEKSTTEPTIPIGQKISNWFSHGLIWKIAALVGCGILFLALLILTIYRLRKRRISKKATVEEPSIDISKPTDNTFMGSQSADVLLTAEVKQCRTLTEKPSLKSKMMQSFKKDDKRDRISSRSSNASSHYEDVENASVSIKSNNNSKQEEVIYQNQRKISAKADPFYQNGTHHTLRQQGLEWNNQEVTDEVIYQNTTASGAPNCHSYVNDTGQPGQPYNYDDSEYASASPLG